MLNFKVKLCDGTIKDMPSPITVVYNSEDTVPADDLTVTFPYTGDFIDRTDFVYAFDSAQTVFVGQADEIITLKSADGIIAKITARSMAGILLDNEAQPCIYHNPSPSMIYEKHLKPYGFENCVTDDTPFFGTLKITKGMSEWQVLDNFCRNKHSNTARVTGGGRVIFERKNSEDRLCFSDTAENGYISMKKSVNRYKVISEVRLKLKEEGRYTGTLKNEAADSRIIRRRLVNALADTRKLDTADKIISQSNNEYFEITLECVGSYFDIVGRKAEIRDRHFGKTGGLYVHKLKYSSGANGEMTTITLRKES